MNHYEIQNEEFDMLLNDVLEKMANPAPAESLQRKVTMRLRLAQFEVSEPVSRHARPASPVLLFSRPALLFSDKTAPRRGMGTTAFAVGLHAAAILLIALLAGSRMREAAPKMSAQLTSLVEPPPPMAPKTFAMGGGGGQPDHAPVSRGTPPKFAAQQIVPPRLPPLDQPKLAIEPTLDVQKDLKMSSVMPNIGIANAPNVGISMGNGIGNGLGSGIGNGIGPGSGGNVGGGIRQVGGGVSAPIEIYRVEPEFSEEARKAKIGGNVLVNLWVDRNGRVTHVSVLKGLGMGLDEKAIEAVRQFRFKPAMENGKPVAVEMNIDVEFQIF